MIISRGVTSQKDVRLTPMAKSTQTTKTKAPRAGRPASAFPERSEVRTTSGTRQAVRHTVEQLTTWRAAAEADGRDLQSWMRHALDVAAEKAGAAPGRNALDAQLATWAAAAGDDLQTWMRGVLDRASKRHRS